MSATNAGSLSERVGWPGDGVHRVPYRVYSDPEIHAEEQRRIFRGPVWNFIGIEFEVPVSGDFVVRYAGDTPVVMVRDEDGVVNVLVNRCGHRGNLVCTRNSGRAGHFTCVYHNWLYDLRGNLTSVAFHRGVGGRGGMPDDFDMRQHGMPRLRTETYRGLVFASFSDQAPPLADYLGAEMRANIERVAGRRMCLLGTHAQYMPNNWKLYMENVRDSYHASLLHMFQAAFRINRLTMDGGVRLSEAGWHHISYSKESTDKGGDETYSGKNLHAMDHGFQLADPSLIDRWNEYPCGTTLAIQSIFPNFIVQQIYNSIALRLCLPKGTGDCELMWWVLGCEDDTPEQRQTRVIQSNMIGPAGLISMEDGVVGGWVQRATRNDGDKTTVLEMGGRDVAASEGSRATEVSIRGFWSGWRSLMGV
jgi:anthranilate 1,2-dioxygenase large subunit/terephthalate 1,2-dioxygenase oxygenase component alpha subunit